MITIYYNFAIFKLEFHPLLNQKAIREFCTSNSIAFQAYSSMGTSDKNLSRNLLENEVINSIAQKHAKTPAQILLKWSVQQKIGNSY